MDLRDLLRERAELSAEQTALLADTQEDGSLSEEAQARDDQINDRIETLNDTIGRMEQARENERLAAGGGQQGNATTEALNDEDEDDEDPDASRIAEFLARDQGWNHIGEMLQAVAAVAKDSSNRDGRLVASDAAAGMGATVPADGGFLIQTQFSDDLLQRSREESVLWTAAANIPIGEGFDRLEEPYIDETSRVEGSRGGGVQVYWADEAEQVPDSRVRIAENELKLEEIVGVSYATRRALRNAVALQALMLEEFPAEFAFKLDDAMYRGNGAGKPLGMLNSPALVEVPIEDGQEPGSIYSQNISKIWARVPARLRLVGNWYINQELEPDLDEMALDIGTGGVPVYLPPGGFSDAPFGRLKGRPVIPIEQASGRGVKGDIMFAVPKQYRTIDQGGIETLTSMHVRFLTREQTFQFVAMVNGQPKWRKALTPANATDSNFKLSPYVTLAARP